MARATAQERCLLRKEVRTRGTLSGSQSDRRKMKIVYVTIRFPFGAGETFLIPELEELTRQGHEVLIVPLRPGARIFHCDVSGLVACARQAPLCHSAFCETQ